MSVLRPSLIATLLGALLSAMGCLAGGMVGDPCDFDTPCPRRRVCAPDSPWEPETCHAVCTSHEDCPPDQRCGLRAGPSLLCTDGGAGEIGESCNDGWDCRGRSLCDLSVIDARCMPYCVGDADCPAGSYCSPIDESHGYCARHCELEGLLGCPRDSLCLPNGMCVDRVGASFCEPVDCPLGTICYLAPYECLTPAEARAR